MKKSTNASSNGKLKVGLAFDDSLDRADGVQQQLRLLGNWLGTSGYGAAYLAGQTELKQISGHKIYSLSRNVSVSANQNRLSLPLPARRGKVDEAFDKERFDVVHITLPFSPFLGRQIVKTAFRRGIPVIGTFHTFPASRLQRLGSWLYGRWLKRYLKRFFAVTSVSEATRDYVAGSFSVESTVIPNYMDTARFAAGRSLASLKDKKHTIVYLNRLVKRKGPQHLLEAVNLLDKQGKFKDSRLILCGRGGLSQELRTRAAELGLAGKVAMPGFIDESDKADYLASADLAVYPATGGEAFGIVLLEAMAAGALVLGGDNPGYRSVLKPRPKLLVDAADHQAMAARIDELLSDQRLRRQLLAWQKSYIKRFDVGAVGPEIAKLYQAAARQP